MAEHLHHVNLIAREVERVRSDRRWRALAFASMGVLAIVLLLSHVAIHWRVGQLRAEEDRLAADIRKYEPDAEEVEERETRHRELTENASLVRTARHANRRWSRLLSQLTAKLPDEVWLTTVKSAEKKVESKASASPSQRLLTIAGASESTEAISKYVTRLNYTEWFAEELQVEQVTGKKIGETPIFEFSVVGELRQPIGEEERS